MGIGIDVPAIVKFFCAAMRPLCLFSQKVLNHLHRMHSTHSSNMLTNRLS
jgi:hypothetical protein